MPKPLELSDAFIKNRRLLEDFRPVAEKAQKIAEDEHKAKFPLAMDSCKCNLSSL